MTLLLLLAVASFAPLDAGQRDVSTEAYLALVVRYSSGEHEAVASELATWPLKDLQKALRDLPAVLPGVSKRQEISETALVGTAMAAHVHVARRANRTEEVEAYLALGHRLAELLPKGEHVSRFKGRWHHAAGTTIFGFSRTADALRQFESAHALVPNDARILLALGSAHESEGSVLARRGAGSDARPTGQGREDNRPTEETAPVRLRRAAKLYEAALAVEAGLDEARLRLARTQWLLQQPALAAETIGDLPDRVSIPYLRYIGLLLDGGIKEALGRRADGIVRYREAAALCHRCPSVMLAFSHALLRAGQRDAARDIVKRIVADDLWPPADDPWWAYQQGQWHAIDAILEQLRREVPK